LARLLAAAVLSTAAPILLAQADPHAGHGDAAGDGMASDAPAGARDPNAYADGIGLTTGPYLLPGVAPPHMADQHSFAGLLLDRFEWVEADDNFGAYDAMAWVGGTYKKLVVKSEGDYADGELDESSTDLLYSRAVSSYWDAQGGLRYDTGPGPNRTWLALGTQGLAPYWFELDATAYLGEGGRTGLKLQAEYELLFTQRLVLQPRAELEIYSKNDPKTATGSGLSNATAGLRLRYEVSRQFAPYLGIEWAKNFGNTADYVRAEGGVSSEVRYVAGIRIWI
jgi:copper resistance protein B